MGDLVRAAHPTIRIVVLSGLLLGLAAIAAGVYFIFAGSSGKAEIVIFNQTISTNNVGVACVFIGVVAIAVALRSALKTVAEIATGESKQSVAPFTPDDPEYEPSKTNKIAALQQRRLRTGEPGGAEIVSRPNMPFSRSKVTPLDTDGSQ